MTSRQTPRPAHTSNAGRSGRRPGRKLAAGGALAFLAAGVVLAGGAQWTAHEVRGALAGMGVEVAGVSVDPVSGVMTLDRVATNQDGVRISVGSITTAGNFALSSAAEAAGAVTLNDIEISGKSLTVRIPRLEVAGDNIDETRLRAVFDKASKVPLGQRLSDITVSRATIPELILLLADGKNETKYTWTQLAITDLKNGVAGAISASGANFASKTGDKATVGSIGATLLEKVNLSLVARLYTEAAASDADRMLQPAYGAFSASDIAVKSDDANVTIKNISGKDFRARLLNTPLLELVAAIEQVKDPEDLEPGARATYYGNVADMMEAFEFGVATATGLTFDVADKSDAEDEDDAEDAGKPGEDKATQDKAGQDKAGKNTADKNAGAASRMRGEIASLSFGSDPATGGGLKFADFRVIPAEGGLITLAEGNLGGFGGKTVAKMFRDYAEASKAGKDIKDLPSLAAFSGDFSLKNLNVDVANDSSPDARIKFSLQGYNGSYGNPVNGIPSNIKTSLDHLIIDLPQLKADADADDDSSVNATITKLRDMGYERVDLSATIDGKWDAATKQLQIGAFSFGAADMGSVKLTGLLGNVSQDLFTSGSDKAQEVLMAARLKTLSLSVSDSGFAQRFATLQAKDQGGDAGQIRAGWAALAQMLLPSMIGTSEGAKSLTGALGAFIRKNGALDITVTSKKPDGDMLGDLATAAFSGNPDMLFNELDFKAVAQ